MQYQGGKEKISKYIAREISLAGLLQRGVFVSLFCGACSVESRVMGFDRIILNDKNAYLIALLRALQNGYIPPSSVSKEEYEKIKADRDADRALAGFVGFSCSFGGIFFGGYAHNARGKNFAEIGRRTILRDMKTLHDAEIICGDYREVKIPPRSVVYADPPYLGTEGYLGEVFDSVAFWEYMRKLSKEGHAVFISEETAPPDFEAIWEKTKVRTLSLKKSEQKIVVEKLFTLRR